MLVHGSFPKRSSSTPAETFHRLSRITPAMLTGARPTSGTLSLPPQPKGSAEGRLSQRTNNSRTSSSTDSQRSTSTTNTQGLVFHIPDPPTCRSQDSIVSGMHRMMQWYRDNPTPGLRPTFGVISQVSLMDQSFTEGPDSYDHLASFPILQPALTSTSSSSLSSKSSLQDINNINFHRNRALAQLEGETSHTSEQTTSDDNLSGPLIDFGPDPCATNPEPKFEPKVHPDLTSLVQCFEPETTHMTLKTTRSQPQYRPRPRPQFQSSTSFPSSNQTKIPKPTNVETVPHRKPLPAERPFNAKIDQLKAPTSTRSSLPVCGPLPEALRIARIEAKSKAKAQPTAKKLPPYPRSIASEATSDAKHNEPRPQPSPLMHGELTNPLQRHPSCLRPCRRLSQRPLPPSNGADVIRVQIHAEIPGDRPGSRATPRGIRESTSYLYKNCPEPPSENLPSSSYQPYRCPEQTRRIPRDSVVRKENEEDFQTPPTPSSPPPKPLEENVVPRYLAYSKTVVRKGTLCELGGRMIHISSKEKLQSTSGISPTPSNTKATTTTNITITQANDTSSIVAEFRRLASMEFRSPPIELTSPQTPTITEPKSEPSLKKHEAGPLHKLGRTATKKLHQASSGFGWRRFSDVDYVDPAVEYSQRQKAKRRVQKWRLLHAVHEVV